MGTAAIVLYKIALWSCECLLWIQNCYLSGEKQILNVGIQYFDVYNANKLLSSKMKVLIKIIELKFYLISVITVLYPVVLLVNISNYVLFQLV